MSYISYVTNYNNDSVSIINSNMGSKPVHTVGPYVTVGDYPWGIAITTDKTYVYVTNSLSNTVSVIQTDNYSVAKTIPVGKYPQTITIQGNYAYVINFQDAKISVIETTTHKVTNTIKVKANSSGIAVTPDGKSAYITSSPDIVSLLDLNTGKITKTINTGKDSYPGIISITPDGKYACISLAGKDQVAIMDIGNNKITDNIAVIDNPQGMAITTDSSYVYIANKSSDKISLISIWLC